MPNARRAKANPHFNEGPRGCDTCETWSDQDAKLNRAGGMTARCLNPASQRHGFYTTGDKTCAHFVRGESIDIPAEA